MPELPEVETIKQGLAAVIGKTVERALIVPCPQLHAISPGVFSAALQQRKLVSAERRGKALLLRFDGGKVLVLQFGMTGQLLLNAGRNRSQHCFMRLKFREGVALTYCNVRKIGRIALLSRLEDDKFLCSLGPEPLSRAFSLRYFQTVLSQSRMPVKNFLMRQDKIAGLGNIYITEALFRARIHPLTPACELNDSQSRKLHAAIKSVLREAITHRGTSIRDYRDSDGKLGFFAQKLQVYGKRDKPCPGCGTVIRYLKIGNRGSFFCPRCQVL